MKRQLTVVRVFAASVAAFCLLTAGALAQDADTVPMTADQQTRLNEAKVALAEAQRLQADLAAQKAARDLAPGSGIAGTVTTSEGAGRVEGAMLSAVALQQAAQCIAVRFTTEARPNRCPNMDQIPPAAARVSTGDPPTLPNIVDIHPTRTPGPILLVVGDNPINLTLAQSYRMRELGAREAMRDAFAAFCDGVRQQTLDTSAIRRANLCPTDTAETGSAENLREMLSTMRFAALFGADLPTINNALSYFRSNYTVGGVTVTGQDDALLMTAVASELARRNVPVITAESGADETVAQGVQADLARLDDLRTKNAAALALVKAQTKAIRDAVPQNASAADRQAAERRAADFVEAESRLSSAIALYDDLRKTLFDSSDNATPAIGPVLNALALEARLSSSNGRLLWVRLNSSNGGYYTESNIFTFLGDVPIHYAGGVVVSYRLLSFTDGRLIEAGVIPMFTGHVRAGRVRDVVSRRETTQQ